MSSSGATVGKPKIPKRLVNATYFFLSFLLFLPFLVKQILPQREEFPHERLQVLSNRWLGEKEKEKSSGKIKYELGLDNQFHDAGLDFKPSVMYRLSFSLLVGSDTGIMSAQSPKGATNMGTKRKRVKWDIEAALEIYFRPLLDQISTLANFTVDSQVLYFSRLSQIKVLRNTKSKENEVTVLDLRNLQGFLSANSWNPESIMENDREVQLNFMLFLPDVLFNNPGIGKTENHRVLIRSENGDLDNNFLIPRWGGICIYDMKEHFRVKEEKKSTVDSIDSHTMDGNVNVSYDRLNTSRAPKQKEERMRLTLQSSDLEVYMRMFAGHLQHLMGIDFSEKKFKESETLWLRYHIDQTFETLGAISNLVASMTHMTVLKRVVDRVETSLDLLEQYMDVISMIDDINTNISFTEKELQNVRLAYQYAEEAFYDPTLIPQLYFPIDQLAATLAPLILPLIPPICMNFMREFKRYRNKIKVKSRNEKEKMN